MDAGTQTLIKKHATYLGVAAWHILTHFHVIVPWLLVPLIFAFRMPIFEPTMSDFATVKISNVAKSNCSGMGFRSLVLNVDRISSSFQMNGPQLDAQFGSGNIIVSKYFQRCDSTGQGHLRFPSIADAEAIMKTQAGKRVRETLEREFSLFLTQNPWTVSLLPGDGNFGEFSKVFETYHGVFTYIVCIFLVDGVFFMIQEYFRWDTFVIRSPLPAFVVVSVRVAITVFLMIRVYPSQMLHPIAASVGGIVCAVIILIPIAILMSNLPLGRLSSSISYACRVLCSTFAVPFVWHIVFVEQVINPIAGPVFTDSTPSSMMIGFWTVGSMVGLSLHNQMDKQVAHLAPALHKQGLIFSLEAMKFSGIYSLIQLLISFSVACILNSSEILWGEWGDFCFKLVGRMFFATAFCTFLTWIAALYVSACLDPHPICSLSITDARLLASSFISSSANGRISYRAFIRIRIVAATFLRWCQFNPDRAVECAFKKSETTYSKDPVKDSVIVDSMCSAIDGYCQDLQCVKLDVSPLKGQSIFLFNWFWQLFFRVSFFFVGHGASLSIVHSNAHSIASVVRALSAILSVAEERVCFGNSVAGMASLQPRVALSSAIFVKVYGSIANLARDLGQLQRLLNEKPYDYSLQTLKPGQPPVLLRHPVTNHQMFPVDPRFVDISDACHSALTQLLNTSPTRLNEVLEMMEKENRKDAKGRLDFMKKNSSLPPVLSEFKPAEIKDHRMASSLLKPQGRLRINPSRGDVDALDPNLEYKVAFEGVPSDQDAWIYLPEDIASASVDVGHPYSDLLQRYLSKM